MRRGVPKNVAASYRNSVPVCSVVCRVGVRSPGNQLIPRETSHRPKPLRWEGDGFDLQQTWNRSVSVNCSVAVARSGTGRLTRSSTGRRGRSTAARGRSAAAGSRSTAGHLAVTAVLLEPAEHRVLLLRLAAGHGSTAGRRGRSTAGRSGRSGTGRLARSGTGRIAGSRTGRIAGSRTGRIAGSRTGRLTGSRTARGRSTAVRGAVMTEQSSVSGAGTGCDHQSGGQSRPLHLEGLLDVT